MAFYQKFTFSNVATFLSDLAAFGTANGWAVITSTSTRTEISKSGVEFRVDYVSTTSVRLYATQSGGSINTSTITITPFAVGSPYMFVSCGASIAIGLYTSSTWNWGGLFNVVDAQKTGSWTGGAMILGINSANYRFFNDATFIIGTLWKDGAWSYVGGSAATGSLKGSTSFDSSLADKQPNAFNGGIQPVDVELYACNSAVTLLHPIGFAPGVYRFNAGNIYVAEETISIDGTNYLVMPYGYGATGTRDLLFKLAA